MVFGRLKTAIPIALIEYAGMNFSYDLSVDFLYITAFFSL
jgi:hypothetical protein